MPGEWCGRWPKVILSGWDLIFGQLSKGKTLLSLAWKRLSHNSAYESCSFLVLLHCDDSSSCCLDICLLSISRKAWQCVMKRSMRTASELPWERRGNQVRQWKLLLSPCLTYTHLLESRVKPNSAWTHVEAFLVIHEIKRYKRYIWSLLPN